MAKRQYIDPMEELVHRIDFPHLREREGKWLQTDGLPNRRLGFSFERLCFYGRRLRDLGMSDSDIACMFSDLYWDAVTEMDLNKEAEG